MGILPMIEANHVTPMRAPSQPARILLRVVQQALVHLPQLLGFLQPRAVVVGQGAVGIDRCQERIASAAEVGDGLGPGGALGGFAAGGGALVRGEAGAEILLGLAEAAFQALGLGRTLGRLGCGRGRGG